MATIKLHKSQLRYVVNRMRNDLEKSVEVVANHVVGKTYITGFIFRKSGIIESYEHWRDIRHMIGDNQIVWKYTDKNKALSDHFDFHDFAPADIYRLERWWKMADISADNGHIIVDIDDWVFRRTLKYFHYPNYGACEYSYDSKMPI